MENLIQTTVNYTITLALFIAIHLNHVECASSLRANSALLDKNNENSSIINQYNWDIFELYDTKH